MLRSGAPALIVGAMLACLAGRNTALAQEKSAADLAQQLSNPVASLISVPFQFNYDARIGPAKLVKIGDQPISLGAGVRYWAESPTTGAHDFGARAVVTFLFPTQQK